MYIEGIRLRTGIYYFQGIGDFGYLVGRVGCIRAKADLSQYSIPGIMKV